MERKRMPHSIDAEKSVLGSVFLDPRVFQRVKDKLVPEDFYDEKNKFIFEAFTRLDNDDAKIDYTTVSNSLASHKRMNQVGTQYLSDIVDFTPYVTNIDEYVTIVKDLSVKRTFITLCSTLYQKGFDESVSTTDYMDRAEEEMLKVIRHRRAGDMMTIAEVMKLVKEQAEEASKPGQGTGLMTGFTGIDSRTNGFQPEEFIILAARPSVGKSAFAVNLAYNIAKSPGNPGVAMFSLEMANKQLGERFLSCASQVDSFRIRTGRLNSTDWTLINTASEQISKYNIFFDDASSASVKEIRAKARKLKEEGRLDFIIIDYLQLIAESGRPGANRQEGVADISRNLKVMARELKVPVLALSQLSRDLEKKEREPVLADLRESGSLEQDADMVMFIYNIDDQSGSGHDFVEVHLAKNRQGSIGKIQFRFDKRYSTFNEVSDRSE